MTSDTTKQPEDTFPATGTSNDSFAADLRGFGPIGILAILLILFTGNIFFGNMIIIPVGAILVLIWVWRSRTPWSDIGYVKNKNWVSTLAVGIVFGIAFKLLMKAFVMPLFNADPINRTYHFLAGNKALLPAAIWGMFVAGFGEETVFRGYLFERFAKLFGTKAWVKPVAVIITSIWFGVAHYTTQGITGIEQATIVGLVFGSIFAITGKIWIVMIAHTAFDFTALTLIYLNLETDVAHFFFK